ncbi:MAG: helix-turn-helix domain-containing protein [Methanomassiliicoccales archaeon]|nr:helix-turn-helix domain-containing protein [Methanomassiliicoccales archaeon]
MLEFFNGVEQGLSLSEIAQRLGAKPGSVYPIVYTLHKFGYLERDPETKAVQTGTANLGVSQSDFVFFGHPGEGETCIEKTGAGA